MDIRLVNREPGAGRLALQDASAQSEAGAATRPVLTGICLTGTALEKPRLPSHRRRAAVG
jgi:hypothetical protein